MSERVRVGVIGTSWFADLMHLPALKSHAGAEIVAICGRSRDRAEEMAKKYDIPLAFTDYREMIDKGNLHALVVITPDDQHYSMTMDALEAGLHVLCEKPLTLSAGRAREMCEKAEAVGVKHMTFSTYRWLPHIRYLRELVGERYIGRCFHCDFQFLWGHGRDGQYRWRFDRKRANGVLGDLGSHMVDLARWCVGDIARVSAHLSTFVERPGADGGVFNPANDSAILVLEFENGAQGMVHVSAVTHLADRFYDHRISLHGESGTLETTLTSLGAEIRGARPGDKGFSLLRVPDRIWGNVDRANPFDVFYSQPVGDRLFIDAILEDQPISPSFYDGLKAQEVIDAAIQSDQQGSGSQCSHAPEGAGSSIGWQPVDVS